MATETMIETTERKSLPEPPERPEVQADWRKQARRLQVKVSPATKRALQPLFFRTRKASPYIVKVAEGLGIREALRLLNEEVRESGQAIVIVTPTKELLDISESNYLPPQVYVRAACVKIAQFIQKEGRLPGDEIAGASLPTVKEVEGS